MEVQMPDDDSDFPRELTFRQLTVISLPTLHCLIHFLDVSLRMCCVLCCASEQDTVKIYILFDWETGLSTAFDTGLTNVSVYFEFHLPPLMSTQDSSKTAINIRLSSDGNSLALRHEADGKFTLRTYSLSTLRTTASPWQPILRAPGKYPITKPASEVTFKWADSLAQSRAQPLLQRRWTMTNLAQTRLGGPFRTCVFYVCVTPPPEGEEGEEADDLRNEWHFVQYYASEAGPYTDERFVLPLHDPVLRAMHRVSSPRGLPVFGLDFNHACYIDQIDEPVPHVDGSGPADETRKKRVLQFVTFPDPLDSELRGDGKAHEFRTLDIPEEVLDVAYHVFLQPSLAAIMITTETNELHTYYYA